MTFEEYFGNWSKIIDKNELYKSICNPSISGNKLLCPAYNDIFNCFHRCELNELKVVILGLSPYPQLGKATGIAFGNDSNTLEENLSPSLQVIKESVIDYEIPHNSIIFDPSFQEWEKQGVLMLNSALTCTAGNPMSHVNVWRNFISNVIYNTSRYMTACVYVLFGEIAQTFSPYIYKHNYIIKEKHPSYYARTSQKLRHSLWDEINKHLNNKINWYEEVFY